MKVILCHPGTQHAGKLASLLRRESLLATFFTGFRVRPDSFLGRRLRLSGLRALDESLADCTHQIRMPELLAKLAQCLGWSGERLMRLRNAWFQKLIPDRALAACDAVIGFDTASWILARRAKKLGKPFFLDRAAIHRRTRAAIRASVDSGIAVPAGDAQDAIETEEMEDASRIVVASRFSESSVREAGIAAEKIAVIPYGVDSDSFSPGEKREVGGGRMVFLFVGLLKKEKGIHTLLAAWSQLAAPGAELWLAGSGEADVIESARRVPGVKVFGKLAQQELRQIYRDADVFVFPTFYDGFGMVLLEAMSSGLPVIATPNCAAPELIRDGEAGVIFSAGDAAALRTAMADAWANRAAWTQRGAAAREIAKSHSWDAYGKRWAALLRDAVEVIA